MKISWKVRNPNRLLKEVRAKVPLDFTTKDIRWTIEHNRCFINGAVENFCSTQLFQGDEIILFVKRMPHHVVETSRIIYEDDAIIVYNKPIYMSSETLAKLTQCHLVHRLDRDTSGLILLAKTAVSQKAFENLFKLRKIDKEYLALVQGVPEEQGVITGQMRVVHKREGAVMWGMSKKGAWSKTEWKRIRTKKNRSLLHCIPHTGRTHQIRVHLKSIGHPILGDFVYGSRKRTEFILRPLLHASKIRFVHPDTQKEHVFTARLPDDFQTHLPQKICSREANC